MESSEYNKKDVGKVILPHILEIIKFYESKGYELKPYPKLVLSKDKSYVNDVFGKTAWYTPNEQSITLLTEGRHPKDIIRSFSHELMHHAQNLRGDMSNIKSEDLADPEYAKNNKTLRKMELEAFGLGGGLLFREWEDSIKSKNSKND